MKEIFKIFPIFIYSFVEYIFQVNYLSPRFILKNIIQILFYPVFLRYKIVQTKTITQTKLSLESFHKRVFLISSFLSFDDTYITYISITSRDVDDTIMHNSVSQG